VIIEFILSDDGGRSEYKRSMECRQQECTSIGLRRKFGCEAWNDHKPNKPNVMLACQKLILFGHAIMLLWQWMKLLDRWNP